MAIAQDLRGRDRVRDHRPRHRRVEPDRRLVGPDQRLRQRAGRQRPAPQRVGLGLRGRVTGQRRPGHAAARGRWPPEVETHLVNVVLTNGARYYVDHAHPELSTPECGDARSVVRFDRSAEVILQRSMDAARRLLPAGPGDRRLQEQLRRQGQLVRDATRTTSWTGRCRSPASSSTSRPHFITRQIFCGAGKVGSEAPGLTTAEVPFQLSQRADFFEEEVGLETTLKRPIVNTRDEPHADAQRYRRLHVIIGDANLSEVATFLKVGTTAIVLAMIEDDVLPRDLRFARAGARPCARSPTT